MWSAVDTEPCTFHLSLLMNNCLLFLTQTIKSHTEITLPIILNLLLHYAKLQHEKLPVRVINWISYKRTATIADLNPVEYVWDVLPRLIQDDCPIEPLMNCGSVSF